MTRVLCLIGFHRWKRIREIWMEANDQHISPWLLRFCECDRPGCASTLATITSPYNNESAYSSPNDHDHRYLHEKLEIVPSR
jgi:hypothetical protein